MERRERVYQVFGSQILDELTELGNCERVLAAPESFDDEPPSRLLTPPLASVRGPLRELGGAAATLLLQLIAGTAPQPPCQVVPMSFVERESLGPLT